MRDKLCIGGYLSNNEGNPVLLCDNNLLLSVVYRSLAVLFQIAFFLFLCIVETKLRILLLKYARSYFANIFVTFHALPYSRCSSWL